MARWDPWSDLFNMQNEMNRWVSEAFGSGPYLTTTTPVGSRNLAAAAQTVYLPLDIKQTDKEFVIEASVPGFTPEEVEVTADQGVLTIRGERKLESDSDVKSTYLRRERAVYSFVRQLTLPVDVKESEISAGFLNGVLTLHLPRVEAPAPRRIAVTAGPAAVESKVLEAGLAHS
ncbi:MAG: Hsp20/alpha crystallin family protein [Candidatus Dormibacteraeota bacterium]|nr:Hsp20/alpha crystallin family protein [Candidatus Dormibacteraeota bacterium]